MGKITQLQTTQDYLTVSHLVVVRRVSHTSPSPVPASAVIRPSPVVTGPSPSSRVGHSVPVGGNVGKVVMLVGLTVPTRGLGVVAALVVVVVLTATVFGPPVVSPAFFEFAVGGEK